MSGEPRRVEVAILGAGTAGLSARRAAKKAGARSVVMIDGGPLGTTCARVGCMPSKLLIAAAEAAHGARHAQQFGVHASDIRVDGPEVLGRVQRERDRFVSFVLGTLDEARAQEELIEQHAKITGNGRLSLADGSQLHYERLVIATGSSAITPPPFRHLNTSLLSNENIFELEKLPQSLLVIGLGVIGLELGQAFARLGVRTTLLGVQGMIGPISDPKVLEVAQNVFSSTLDLHANYQLNHIEEDHTGVRIGFVDSQGRQREEHFERVLMAAGRRNNLDGLGLDALGLQEDERGQYPVNPDTLQLGDGPLFTAGDANGLHPLLHEASDDGHIAGENAARYPELRAPRRRTPLTVVFSDPQIALVGQAYKDLSECTAAAGEVSYDDQGRSRVHGQNRGLVRIYAERRSGRLLGAEMFGPRMEHMSHLLAWSVQQGLTVGAALDMPFYHPAFEEGVRTALRDLQANLQRGERIKCRVSELGVGS